VQEAEAPEADDPPLRPELDAVLRAVSMACTECMVCVRQCGFLERHGSPRSLADCCTPSDPAGLTLAYACSLCGLCTSVCSHGVDPASLFLEMRREAVERGAGPLREHSGLLAFERRGTSSRYSFHALPEGCDTVFFPGCTFTGTRSEAVLALQERLEASVPNLGIVLDCCTKPSHDLGRDEYFRTMFGELRDNLVRGGIRTVLVACPNCYKVFQRYGGALQVRSIYELLAERGGPDLPPLVGTVTVHDPCVIRDVSHVRDSARTLLRGTGLQVQEMQSTGRKTLCCGEGGGVGLVDPELAQSWGRRRRTEANGHRVVTYCAGCAAQLGRHVPTSHVADLLLDREAALDGRARVARPPFTYWKRLRMKRTLQGRMTGARTLARRHRSPGGILGVALVAAVAVVHTLLRLWRAL
jgi:Fe-S oxidoreductase